MWFIWFWFWFCNCMRKENVYFFYLTSDKLKGDFLFFYDTWIKCTKIHGKDFCFPTICDVFFKLCQMPTNSKHLKWMSCRKPRVRSHLSMPGGYSVVFSSCMKWRNSRIITQAWLLGMLQLPQSCIIFSQIKSDWCEQILFYIESVGEKITNKMRLINCSKRNIVLFICRYRINNIDWIQLFVIRRNDWFSHETINE